MGSIKNKLLFISASLGVLTAITGCTVNEIPISKESLLVEPMLKEKTSQTKEPTNIQQNLFKLKEKVMLNAPVVKQLPELPRGCEVTSLAMLLLYAGVNIDKMTLAKEVKKNPTPYREENGKVYFGHPNYGFVGNMYDRSEPGYGVYHKPIFELAKKYLPDRAVNLTGSSFYEVMKYVQEGYPVWVINNMTYKWLPEQYWETWETPQGQIEITRKEHSVLITGFDQEYVYFNDPLRGKYKAPKTEFIKSWEQMGSQAISYRNE